MQAMPKQLTTDDIIPLVASLTPAERVRLLRLIASSHGGDSSIYETIPPAGAEFSTDEEPLAREGEGWEDSE